MAMVNRLVVMTPVVVSSFLFLIKIILRRCGGANALAAELGDWRMASLSGRGSYGEQYSG
jgi:hypothetical protein